MFICIREHTYSSPCVCTQGNTPEKAWEEMLGEDDGTDISEVSFYELGDEIKMELKLVPVPAKVGK